MSHLGKLKSEFDKKIKFTRRYYGNTYMKMLEHMLIVITIDHLTHIRLSDKIVLN